MPYNILIVNPNSSESVTANLANILEEPPNVKFHYYTAPSSAPKEISGQETSILSEQAVLPDLLAQGAVKKYDGFLIGCYSDHPLIHTLGKHTSKPVLGIMQATLLYSLSNPAVSKSFVLTSFDEWETLLDKGIVDFVGSPGTFPVNKFQRTRALNISVLNLSDPKEYAKIESRVHAILDEFKEDNINCILLGCAGMAGLDEKLASNFPGIIFVDSCKVGVEFLTALVRAKGVIPGEIQ